MPTSLQMAAGDPELAAAVRRARKARAFLQANGYIIRHSAMVWCQGCTDGDLDRKSTRLNSSHT